MAICLGRQLHQRVVDAALDIAGAIRAGNDDACRAVARNAQGDGVPVILEHGAHQAGTRQQAAQGSTAGGARGVKSFCFTDNIRRIYATKNDSAVF